MKYTPVKIDVENSKIYAQIAFLIDSPVFIDQISDIRFKYGIKKPFKDIGSWVNHNVQKVGFNLDEFDAMQNMTLKNRDVHTKSEIRLKWFETNKSRLIKLLSVYKSFNSDLAKIRKYCHYPATFDAIISQVILFNRIRHFSTATSDIFWGGKVPNVEDLDTPTIGIFVSPFSDKKDVLKEFDTAKKRYKEEYDMVTPIDPKLDTDTLTNIVRNRTWHWEQLNGRTYGQINDEWNRKCPNSGLEGLEHDNVCKHCIMDTNTIEQAVARYRRNLQKWPQKTDI